MVLITITLQNDLLKYNEDFKTQATPLMSYDIFDRNDPNNWLKRCPNCSLIWMKIDACSNTTCGNRGSLTLFDVFAKAFWKFVLKKIDGRLQWSKNEKPAIKIVEFGLVKDDGKKIASKAINYSTKSFKNNFDIDINKDGSVGCGRNEVLTTASSGNEDYRQDVKNYVERRDLQDDGK